MQIDTFEKASDLQYSIKAYKKLIEQIEQGKECTVKVSAEGIYEDFEVQSTKLNELVLPMIQLQVKTLEKEFEEM